MNTTNCKPASEIGFCHIGYAQRGRQNAKYHLVTVGGHVVYVNAQDGTKAGALKLAARIDRLVARWRAL